MIDNGGILLAGVIKEATKGTSTPVRVCGAMLILGGLICCLIPWAQSVQEYKERMRRRKSVVRVDAAVQVKPSDFYDPNEQQYKLALPLTEPNK